MKKHLCLAISVLSQVFTATASIEPTPFSGANSIVKDNANGFHDNFGSGANNSINFIVSIPESSSIGDYQVLTIGGSSGAKTGNFEPADRPLMERQGFTLIGARSYDEATKSDRKIEIWIRKDNGSAEHQIAEIDGSPHDVPWNITILDGTSPDVSNLDYSLFSKVANVGSYGTSDNYNFKHSSGYGFSFFCTFFDDPAKISTIAGGQILCDRYGFGDGDGLTVVFFAPGVPLPVTSTIWVKPERRGGNQFAYQWFSSKR